jgi:hypothetical protein
MSSIPISPSSLLVQPVSDRLLPDEGPKGIPLLLDFSLNASYSVDLTNVLQTGYISMLQTLYIDLSDPALGNVSVDTGVSVQTITAKAQTQGYYNALIPNPPKLTFRSTGGAGVARIILINVAIPGHVWATV